VYKEINSMNLNMLAACEEVKQTEMSRNYRFCVASLTAAAWLTQQQSCRLVYGILHQQSHAVQFSLPS